MAACVLSARSTVKSNPDFQVTIGVTAQPASFNLPRRHHQHCVGRKSCFEESLDGLLIYTTV